MQDTLSPQAFRAVTDLFHQVSGIRLTDAKQALVAGRLQRLAQDSGAPSLEAYVDGLLHGGDAAERTRVVDKLTTNETYFFREPQHFDLLARLAAAHKGPEFRVWSAACSSGEEAYSIAMVLAESLPAGVRWEVVGTDLSTSVVAAARRALYPMERARNVPTARLKRWCLKGDGAYAGKLLICRELRQHARFDTANLMEPLPQQLGQFDILFLRNMLIYFDNPAKQKIVRRVIETLKPGGLLFTGHAESLANLDLPLKSATAAVYARA
jgi:chemotaxis protein methyltransferase CheR